MMPNKPTILALKLVIDQKLNLNEYKELLSWLFPTV